MLLTIDDVGKEIVMNSPVLRLGYTMTEFQKLFVLNNKSFYSSLEWAIRSAEILKRDNWICKFCGDTYANYVHHIRGARQFPEICLHPDYLVTVCVECHHHLHRKKKK